MSDVALNWIDGQWRTSATIPTSQNQANDDVVGQFADGREATIRYPRPSSPLPTRPGDGDETGPGVRRLTAAQLGARRPTDLA